MFHTYVNTFHVVFPVTPAACCRVCGGVSNVSVAPLNAFQGFCFAGIQMGKSFGVRN
jgi:hypothetical protein